MNLELVAHRLYIYGALKGTSEKNIFRICGHRFESVGTDLNLWERIAICGHIFESVGTDSNLWERIAICGTHSNLWEQIRICGNGLQTNIHVRRGSRGGRRGRTFTRFCVKFF